MEEKGSEVGLEILDREKVEDRVLRVRKPHGQSAVRRMVWQMLIWRSGQPERALKLGTVGHHLGWQKFLNWGKYEEGSAFWSLGGQYGSEVKCSEC